VTSRVGSSPHALADGSNADGLLVPSFQGAARVRAHVSRASRRSRRDFVESDKLLRAWFRAQDSNPTFWVQSPASYRIDDPGIVLVRTHQCI
jgi:hypothetical protein